MPHLDDTATLGDYWSTLRRRRRLIGVCTVIGLLLAGGWTAIAPTAYSAHASVVIRQIQSDPFATTRIEDVGASTEVNVMDSTVVAARAAKKLSDADALELVRQLSVTNPTGTLVLDLTFTDASPRRARAGAQAFANAYLDYRQERADTVKQRKLAQVDAQLAAMHSELDETLSVINDATSTSAARTSAEARRGVVSSRIGDLELSRSELDSLDTTPGEIIRPADLPVAPNGPGRALTILGGGMFGLLAGVVLALVRDRSDRHLLGHRDLVELLDAEPLGEIPPTPLPVPVAHAAAGELRRLRARVWPDRVAGPRRVLITAPTTARDADDAAAAIALTIASTGWTSLVTWLDRNDLPNWVDVDDEVVLRATNPDSTFVDRLVELEDRPGLNLLPALGSRTAGDDAGDGPLEVAARRLDDVDGLIDITLLVGEPILDSPQAVELAPLVDGVIVAFDVRSTTRTDLVRALETLGTSGKVLGVVATSVPSRW